MKELDNLVKINQLKMEPADASEFAGMLRAGNTKLKDALIADIWCFMLAAYFRGGQSQVACFR